MTRMSHLDTSLEELAEVRKLLIAETAKNARLQGELDASQAKLKKALELLRKHNVPTSLEHP